MSEFKRQHPIAAVTGLINSIKQNFITILILLFIGTSNTEGYFLYFLMIGIGLALFSGVFGWWVFRYRVHNDELQIKKGIFVKKNMYMSKDRIQVIDITEGIIQRAFGLVQVEVKTAGGGTESATISAIARDEAEELRTELRNKNNGNGQDGDEVINENDGDSEILDSWELPKRDLVYAAFTSGNFGLIASILGAISGQLDDFINEETLDYLYEVLPGYSDVYLVIFIILAIIIISWFLSFLGVIFKYTDFKLQKTREELIITSGLFEKKHITVPFDRVQAVRFVEGILRQPFGKGMIYIESAGFDQSQQGRSIVLSPFISADHVDFFMGSFLEMYEIPKDYAEPPKRSKYRYLRRPNYLLLLVIPLILFLTDYGWVTISLIPLATYLGWLRFQDAQLGTGEKTIMMRYRVLARTTAYVLQKRIQNIDSRINPFQKRKKVSDFSITAASGAGGMNFELRDLDESDSLRFMNWCVYGTSDTDLSASSERVERSMSDPNVNQLDG